MSFCTVTWNAASNGETAGERKALPSSSTHSDWDQPFTDEELQAIEAAFQSAASSSPIKSRRVPYSDDRDSDGRPKTRRRLPHTISLQVDANRCQKGSDSDSSTQRSHSFAMLRCSKNSGLHLATVKMRYPMMNFEGHIKWVRWFLVLTLGRPTFGRGIPQRKAAVMQICGSMTHCYVMHIIHSGIPHSLQSLLEDSFSVKVGVGIGNDAVKVFQDHNVSIRSVEDLSNLANQKLGREPRQWSLSSLVEMLTCKQLLKPNKIRLGNWEADVLSTAQLQYAATDAFASWYLYQVLKTSPLMP
ncbi:hypothetical protein Nepgr_020325 [Nepenthes gracilis]|uniref:3'-5' exonuclease n=1 Tax=Nepenthes gracilis TaxID=150966 RepID=A0AAD3SXF7_NEPGR|nr:hypothetical protein Nepgr_020325 [Nepenthes gracilis]